jgi:putative ABC transport system permease protein
MRVLPFEHAVRNAMRRPVRSLFMVLATALVTALLVGTSAFVRSLERSTLASAPEKTAILVSLSSLRDLVRSSMSASVADLVAADTPGVVQLAGMPASSPEIHMGTKLRSGPDQLVRQGFVRGVTERAWLVHEAVTLIAGRAPGPGEAIVGRLAASKCGAPAEDFAIGQKLWIEGGEFEIVGEFAAGGSTVESEIWVPLGELQALAQRQDVSGVFVRVNEEDALSDVSLFANRRLDLELVSITAKQYYRELASYFEPILALAWAMAILVGLAAAVGGANLVLSAVQERRRELAIFRAIGFRGPALIFTVLEENLVLTMAGALFGLVATQLLLAQASFGMAMTAFELEVGPASLLIGLLGILAIMLIGAVPALLHVLRMPVTQALHSA